VGPREKHFSHNQRCLIRKGFQSAEPDGKVNGSEWFLFPLGNGKNGLVEKVRP
jgi:hypothetical protein